jgi:hypothetical protein
MTVTFERVYTHTGAVKPEDIFEIGQTRVRVLSVIKSNNAPDVEFELEILNGVEVRRWGSLTLPKRTQIVLLK